MALKSLKTFCLLALLALALPGLLVRARQLSAHCTAQAQRASSCRDCHQQVFDSYTQTAHFNTSGQATAQTIKGNFAGGHNLLRTRSENVFFKLERRADGFYQTGYESAQSQTNSRTEPFDLALGSGRKGQSYLFWKDGLLYQLPVSWLVGTKQWINSPGYEDGRVNFLYLNKGDGTFTDIAYGANVGYDANGKPRAGMGVEMADYDNDGWFDLFVTNFSEEFNGLFRNHGDQTFDDVAEQAGLGSSFLPLGFGAKLFDFDNDGDLDIFVTNGHVIDNIELYHKHLSYQQTDLLYANERGRFTDVSSAGGPAFQIKHVGRGAATGDFDNDGDLDIIVSNSGERPMLLRNDGGNKNHWLAIKARGKESNRFGVGARLTLDASLLTAPSHCPCHSNLFSYTWSKAINLTDETGWTSLPLFNAQSQISRIAF